MSAARKKTVVLGFLGSTLDQGGPGPKRWTRWRPTVALCSHQDLEVARLELLHTGGHAPLAQLTAGDIARVSPSTEVRLRVVDTPDPWDFESVFAALHDLAVGYPFDLDREEYLLHITTGTHVAQICLFLLAESRHFPARLLQTSPPRAGGAGADGPGRYAMIDLDLSRYDRIASRFRGERRLGASALKSGIATRNEAFNALIDRVERVASGTRAPILLMGPTGAGKSLLARRIFELKKTRRRLAGGLVEANCATLRGDTAMSTLFGHRKGAFTGALSDRPGLLRAADGGVLFLDEVGELGADEQAMLLRALEERRFLPVGADREAESDFELLAGTNRDLAAEVRAGRFREDLYARINLWTFRLPPLRERPEDLAPNLQHELDACERTLGVRASMSREARERYLAFGRSPAALWAANFRDLNASVLRMAALADGARIDVAIVEEEVARLAQAWAESPLGAGPGDGAAGGAEARLAADLALAREALGPKAAHDLDRFDLVQLAETLRVCAASRTLSEAGRVLFAASIGRRSTRNDADRLRKYLARFGLEGKDVVGR